MPFGEETGVQPEEDDAEGDLQVGVGLGAGDEGGCEHDGLES